MPEVVMRLTAEEGQVVQALLNVVEKQKRVEEGFAGIARAGKHAHGVFEEISEGASEAAGKIANDLVPGITQIGSVSGAAAFVVETAFKAIELGIEKTTERAKEFHGVIQSLTEAAAKAGMINLLPELKEKVDAIKSDRVSNAEKEGGLGHMFSKFGGGKLNAEQILESVEFGTKAREGGLDLDTASDVYGTLRQFFPKASKEEIEKVAGKLANKSIEGDEVKQIARAAASGQSVEQAGANVFALRFSGESARGVAAADAVIGQDLEQLKSQPVKQISDPAIKEKIADLERQKLEFEKEKARLQTQKEDIEHAAFDEHGGPRDLQKLQRKGSIKDIDRQMDAIRRPLGDIELDLKELRLKEKIDDPKAAATRKAMIAINSQQTEGEQFEAVLSHPEVLADKLRKAVMSFVQGRRGFAGAPNLVAKNISDREGAAAADAGFGASDELKKQLRAGADVEHRLSEDPRGLQTEAGAQFIRNKALAEHPTIGSVLGSAEAGIYRALRFFGADGGDATAATSGGGAHEVLKTIAEHVERTADNTESKRPKGVLAEQIRGRAAE